MIQLCDLTKTGPFRDKEEISLAVVTSLLLRCVCERRL